VSSAKFEILLGSGISLPFLLLAVRNVRCGCSKAWEFKARAFTAWVFKAWAFTEWVFKAWAFTEWVFKAWAFTAWVFNAWAFTAWACTVWVALCGRIRCGRARQGIAVHVVGMCFMGVQCDLNVMGPLTYH
jgi:hypothetical protein